MENSEKKVVLNGKEITEKELEQKKKELQEKKMQLVEVSPNVYKTRLFD